MRAALIQLPADASSPADRLEAHVDAVRQAREQDAELVVFPELSLSGYLVSDTAGFARQTPDLIDRIAHELVDETIVVGAPWKHPDGAITNSAIVLTSRRIVHRHDKIYLPDYGSFTEGARFATGNTVSTFAVGPFRAAVLICEDAWHAFLPYLAVLQGADVLVVPAASAEGAASSELDAASGWRAVNMAWSILYSAYVLFCNYAGDSGGFRFLGGSSMVSPTAGSAAITDVASAEPVELDLAVVEQRRAAVPTLSSERPGVSVGGLHQLGWISE